MRIYQPVVRCTPSTLTLSGVIICRGNFYPRKHNMQTFHIYAVALLVLLAGPGCAPEVGSEAWCKKIAEKTKGEWTANEAADYAKHCLFK